MTQPLVTVLVDTFNYGHFIEEAIASVLQQDFPREQFEILVVDDGSTDDTSERVKKYGSQLVYLAKPNGGQASAFNLGVKNARGEIIAMLDADDYWLPAKLGRVAAEFQSDPAVGMVHHRMQERNVLTGEVRPSEFFPLSGNLAQTRKSILAFSPTSTSSLAFRRGVLEKIVPIPEAITIQADGFIQALAPFLGSVAAVDETLGVYRIHDSNLYNLSKTEQDIERRKRRAITLRAIVVGLRDWFLSHGFDLASPIVRATLSRWTTLREREEFAVTSPSRMRFLMHLLESHRNHFPLMTWRLVVTNYLDALAALVVGYENFPGWQKGRENLMRRVRSFIAGGHSPRAGEG